jgi:hypothetical protein
MRVQIHGRLVDARSNGEPGPGVLRERLVVPQLLALAALAVAHLFDYTSFLVLVGRHGLAAEANPIVVSIAQQAGLLGLTIAKLGTVTFAALLVILIAPRRHGLAVALLVFGVCAGMIGGFSNVASF